MILFRPVFQTEWRYDIVEFYVGDFYGCPGSVKMNDSFSGELGDQIHLEGPVILKANKASIRYNHDNVYNFNLMCIIESVDYYVGILLLKKGIVK